MARRRRRIRWDRIAVAAVALVILILLFGSCAKRCFGGSDDESSSKPDASSAAQSTTDPGAAVSQPPASSGMVNLPQVVTDAVPSQSLPIATEATTTASEISTGIVLPDNYQAMSVSNDAVHKGNLILVNKDNPCMLTKENLDLQQVSFSTDKPDTYEVSYPGHTFLDKTALSKFTRLMKAYYGATTNSEIMFNYGWLEAGKEKSNPESPTALDVQLHVKRTGGAYEYITNTSPFSWLFEHMDSYGFVQRYPDDKTDLTGYKGGYTAIRYVGVPHAAYMKENHLCLEEYLNRLKDSYTFGKGILDYSTSELTYKIYYFPASKTGTTEIPVPKTGSYEISGNNVDGFIVTVIVA